MVPMRLPVRSNQVTWSPRYVAVTSRTPFSDAENDALEVDRIPRDLFHDRECLAPELQIAGSESLCHQDLTPGE